MDNLPYRSPLNRPFKTLVPLYIHSRAAQGFCQSIIKSAANMREVDGNRVAYANVSLPIIAEITYYFEA